MKEMKEMKNGGQVIEVKAVYDEERLKTIAKNAAVTKYEVMASWPSRVDFLMDLKALGMGFLEVVSERDSAKADHAWMEREINEIRAVLGPIFQSGGTHAGFACPGESLVSAVPRLVGAYNRMVGELDAARAELDTLRERACVPVKVKLPDVEEVNGHLIKNNFSTTPRIEMGEALRYAAAHAVIDAPAGVPSVQELEILFREARDACGTSAAITAIRDRVLAAVGRTYKLNPANSYFEGDPRPAEMSTGAALRAMCADGSKMTSEQALNTVVALGEVEPVKPGEIDAGLASLALKAYEKAALPGSDGSIRGIQGVALAVKAAVEGPLLARCDRLEKDFRSLERANERLARVIRSVRLDISGAVENLTTDAVEKSNRG